MLQLEPHNAEALLRRGKAYAAKGKVASAVCDLLDAKELLTEDEPQRREATAR